MDLEDGGTSGQKRRVLFPSKGQRSSEQLRGQAKRKDLDMLFIVKDWVKKQAELKGMVDTLSRLVDICQKEVMKKLLEESKDYDAGYPRLHEMEFMMTPCGAGPQDPHADTKFNIVSAFIRLDTGDGKSTWTVKKDSFEKAKQGTPMNELDYQQLPFTKDKVEVVINHATWPHYGPGNKGSELRYVLFFAFAVDLRATRHTTSEEVLRFV
jgi:hypothetical protein